MKEFQFKITDPMGMHARPAGIFVKEATSYESDISIIKGDIIVDAKKMFRVMGLAISYGEEITIRIEGSDEEKAVQELEDFMKNKL